MNARLVRHSKISVIHRVYHSVYQQSKEEKTYLLDKCRKCPWQHSISIHDKNCQQTRKTTQFSQIDKRTCTKTSKL